jgi:hypothetical protein
VLGAFAFAGIALNHNEPVSAAWLVTAAICVYLIAYRFYSKFIATKVLQLDDARLTPAERHNDGLDFVPTSKYVVFGHHFAAIAGAGPLVGPVLAAQMGYLPGTLWILVGVVFAGAVQDFVILFCSIRRDGRSLGEMVKMEMGPIAGGVALVGTLGIMIIILAALGLVVVKALGESPWGTFTVAITIPTAMVMGVYMRSIRPGKVGEASAFGVVRCKGRDAWARLHLQRAGIGVGHHHIRRHCFHAAGMAPSRAARLPQHVPEDRGDCRSCDRYLSGSTRSEDAGGNPIYRWYRTRLLWTTVPIPVHHHRVRCRVGLPFADLVWHHAQDD